MAKRKVAWNADRVRALRRHLGLTQVKLAEELGTRQATISEWEHGLYRPRGASARILGLLAQRAGFAHERRDDGPQRRAAGPRLHGRGPAARPYGPLDLAVVC